MNSWSLAAFDHATTTITISGVDNHKSYVVGVRAKNAHGGSEWRNSDSIAPQVPAAPSSVNLSRGNGTLTANWPAVSGATKYHITYSSDGGWNWNLAVYGHTFAGLTLSNVDNGKPYIVGVRAGNAYGYGDWKNSDSIAPIYTPGQVSDLSATRSGTGISVTWNAPDNNGGSAVTGYDVNYTADGVHSWTRVHTGLDPSTTSATISDVDNAVDYVVAVRANNGVGEGAWTNSAPAAPAPALSASGVTTSTATLTLSNHAGAWWLKRTNPTDATCKSKGTTATESLTGLTPGATYTYKAYSDGDCANELATETFTTLRLTVSVSNLDKPAYQYASDINANAWTAVAFTTGTSTAGYTLTSFTAKFATSSEANNVLGDIVVSLHANDSGVPATSTLATLSGDNPDTPGEYTYTCSGSGCALATSTTYFAQFKATAGTNQNVEGYKLLGTESDDETQTPDGNGWSLANTMKLARVDGGGWPYAFTYDDIAYLKVSATVNP